MLLHIISGCISSGFLIGSLHKLCICRGILVLKGQKDHQDPKGIKENVYGIHIITYKVSYSFVDCLDEHKTALLYIRNAFCSIVVREKHDLFSHNFDLLPSLLFLFLWAWRIIDRCWLIICRARLSLSKVIEERR